MMFNATFHHISVISWSAVLLGKGTYPHNSLLLWKVKIHILRFGKKYIRKIAEDLKEHTSFFSISVIVIFLCDIVIWIC